MPVLVANCGSGCTSQIAIVVIAIQVISAGASLFVRRLKNVCKNLIGLLWAFLKTDCVITYPDITKNISTPRNPDGSKS